MTCPVCSYTTPAVNVRKQFVARKGGTADARLLAVVVAHDTDGAKCYRKPNDDDLSAVRRAQDRLGSLETVDGELPAIPNEPLPYLRSIFNINLLGVTEWGQLLTPRQALHIATFVSIIRKKAAQEKHEQLARATATCMGIALDKMVDFHTSLTRWIYLGEKIGNTFGRQALGIIWDYAEANPFADMSGSWDRCVDYLAKVVEHTASIDHTGHVEQASATEQSLPDSSASALVTDPPYYDLVPYADLSDFFYVWLKRSIGYLHSPLFDATLSPKHNEIVQLAERNRAYAYKTRENFEKLMGLAMEQGRRVLQSERSRRCRFRAQSNGRLGSASCKPWLDAGWIITGSWPIDTEMEKRMRAMD